jgi:L,D-peptidoglycan transpeptidase YkuD (ErfK/YbiS/YcfS/YnhG family)
MRLATPASKPTSAGDGIRTPPGATVFNSEYAMTPMVPVRMALRMFPKKMLWKSPSMARR